MWIAILHSLNLKTEQIGVKKLKIKKLKRRLRGRGQKDGGAENTKMTKKEKKSRWTRKKNAEEATDADK